MCGVLLKICFCKTESKGDTANAALEVIPAKIFKAVDHLAVCLKLLCIAVCYAPLKLTLFCFERNDIIKGTKKFLIKRT